MGGGGVSHYSIRPTRILNTVPSGVVSWLNLRLSTSYRIILLFMTFAPCVLQKIGGESPNVYSGWHETVNIQETKYWTLQTKLFVDRPRNVESG